MIIIIIIKSKRTCCFWILSSKIRHASSLGEEMLQKNLSILNRLLSHKIRAYGDNYIGFSFFYPFWLPTKKQKISNLLNIMRFHSLNIDQVDDSIPVVIYRIYPIKILPASALEIIDHTSFYIALRLPKDSSFPGPIFLYSASKNSGTIVLLPSKLA